MHDYQEAQIEVLADMTWPAIITALEKATGPSREIDAMIAEACGWVRRYVNFEPFWCDAEGRMRLAPKRYTDTIHIGHTIALVEERFPTLAGNQWILQRGELLCSAAINVGDDLTYVAVAPSVALALCLAFARAMAERKK